MFFFWKFLYLPNRQHRTPVSLCPDMFPVGTVLELHYPVSRSGPEDKEKPCPQSDQRDTRNLSKWGYYDIQKKGKHQWHNLCLITWTDHDCKVQLELWDLLLHSESQQDRADSQPRWSDQPQTRKYRPDTAPALLSPPLQRRNWD